MADEELAGRVEALLKKEKGLATKKMFGGTCFLINGNMCCGTANGRVMVRIHADGYEAALKEKGVKPMDFTGRPIRGFLFLTADGARDPALLRKWVGRALAHAKTLPPKTSKKK